MAVFVLKRRPHFLADREISIAKNLAPYRMWPMVADKITLMKIREPEVHKRKCAYACIYVYA